MSSFRPAYFDCPACAGRFSAFLVQSVGCNGQDSDLYTHFLGAMPLVHFVKVCPGCGFAGTTDEFAIHPEGEIADPREGAVSFVGEEDRALNAYVKYMALAQRLVAEGAAPQEVGDACMSASYCARLDSPDKVAMLREKALAEFLRAADLPQAGRKTLYLAAELLRLHGRCKEASERLKAFLALPADDEQSSDLRAFAAILLRKSLRGSSREVEFRWDEDGTLKWKEWSTAGRESAWKKQQKRAHRRVKPLFDLFSTGNP
jgi:hypothetical protein